MLLQDVTAQMPTVNQTGFTVTIVMILLAALLLREVWIYCKQRFQGL